MNLRRIKFSVIVCLLCCSVANAQLSEWQKGILVDRFIYDTASFPQCHSATIVETPAGLVAAWFGGTREGHPDVEIWLSRMVNSTWTSPVSVANGIMSGTLRKPCYNPVLYQLPGGELLLFYKIGKNVGDWKGFMKTSGDNGLTWSEQRPLQEGFLGPVKNKPVMLSDGKLIAPSSTEGSPGWRVHFEISDDKGKTWRKVGPINSGTDYNIIQPSVLTHKGGRLQILARSRQHVLVTSWSKDGGESWSKPEPSGLPNNNSGTDAVTLRDGRQLVVYNHRLPDSTWVKGKGPRTPLNVAISNDGKKWFAAAILEDSPISQYSYPSVIQSADGMVHIVYTWRRLRIKYVKLDPKKLVLKEIVGGKWPEMKGYASPTTGEVTSD